MILKKGIKKEAFTLVEILAIIVILGVIITLITTSILGFMESSKEKAYNVLVETVQDSAKLYFSGNNEELQQILLTEGFFEITLEDLVNRGLLDKIIIDPRNKEEIPLIKKVLIIRNESGTISYCYEDNDCPEPNIFRLYFNNSKGVNKPQLAEGMTPIKWNGSVWVYTTENDLEWYNYNKKKWANAKTEDGSFWV